MATSDGLCFAALTAKIGTDWGAASTALTEHGYAVLPGAMPELGWRSLRAEAEQLLADDAFSPARIGRGDGL